LSDKELLAQIETIRRREHLSTLGILTHLNEIERRKLHLKLGYSSLFDYCVKHLRYSTSGAGRRVAVARCVARHPEVFDMLRSRAVTVTGVALVASVIRDGNKAELLESIQNKTQSEIDQIAARYRPPIALRDRVKPVKVRIPESSPAPRDALDEAKPHTSNSACEKRNYSHSGSDASLSGSQYGRTGYSNSHNTRIAQKLLIQFLADEEFMKKYEEVRALLSQRLPDTSFANIFEALIGEFLDRHSPTCRKARRDHKNTARQASVQEPRRAERPRLVARSSVIGSKRRSRHISAAVRDEVFTRDKGRCTYVGATGRRCASTQALQVDHITPFTRGGSNAASNLRILCAKHNRLAAEEMLGEHSTKRFRLRE
jgi:5-methylcytosine-specific restriction endonuclease McrA